MAKKKTAKKTAKKTSEKTPAAKKATKKSSPKKAVENKGASPAMTYRMLKNPIDIERTAMGLMARYNIKKSAKLANLMEENYQAVSEDDLLKAWFPALKKNDKKTIVVITAHDDDLISFSGSISKLANENNAEIHHLILTDGSMGCGEDAMTQFISPKELKKLAGKLTKLKSPKKDKGYHVIGDSKPIAEYAKILKKAGKLTAKIRQEEAREAEKILGWQHTYFLNFPDTALGLYHFGHTPYEAPGATAVAIRLVKDINPDLMILQDRHQVVDFNPDHYAAGMIGYTIFWHLHCPVLGVDGLGKPFKAVVQRGFEGIGRHEFRLCDYLIHLNDTYLDKKLNSLYAYKNQLELVNDLFKVEEKEKFRVEGFFEVDTPPATIG